MLHQLLTLTRPMFVLDTESTGLDTKTDRIVEIGFQQWDATGMVKEWRSLVNPGIPIPEAATRVHHITDEDVTLRCRYCNGLQDFHVVDTLGSEHDPVHAWVPWPTFKQLAPNLAKGLATCDYAGQSVRYDLQIIAAEMQRAGQSWSYAGARIIDSSKLEQIAVPRNLSALHEKYVRTTCPDCGGSGRILDTPMQVLHADVIKCRCCNGIGDIGMKHDGAHGALSDVRAATTVIALQLKTHTTLPRDLDTLHQAQWPGYIDDGGSFRFVDGIATCQFGKHRGKAIHTIPNDYWDWILKSDFPVDVKTLASAAKLGKWPEEKIG